MFLKPQAPVEAPVVPAAPAVPPRRQKVAAKDARIFQPSNFASRRAEAEVNNAIRSRRRLISLGQSEFHQRGNTGDITVLDVQLFYDRDKPSDRFVEWPDQMGLTPLQSDEPAPASVKLPPITGRPRFAGAFDPSQPTAPPRPV